jgi:hypothetical protein
VAAEVEVETAAEEMAVVTAVVTVAPATVAAKVAKAMVAAKVAKATVADKVARAAKVMVVAKAAKVMVRAAKVMAKAAKVMVRAGLEMGPPAAKVMARHRLLRTRLRQTHRLRPLACLGILALLRMRRQMLLRQRLGLLELRHPLTQAPACQPVRRRAGVVWVLGLDRRALKGLPDLLTAKTAKTPTWSV